MGEVMLHGVLNMPIDIWGDDHLSKIQRHSRYVEASELIIKLEQERDQYKERSDNWVYYQGLLKQNRFAGITDLLTKYRALERELESIRAQLKSAQDEYLRLSTPKDDEFAVYETFYLDALEWLRPHIDGGKLPRSVSEAMQFVIEFWKAAQEQEPISNVDVYYDFNDSGGRILTWDTFGSNFKSLGVGKHKLYAAPVPAQQSKEIRGANEYGLDMGYFAEKLNIFLRDISRYRPSEAARVMARLAMVADEKVLTESEFSQQSPAVAVPDHVIADIKELIDFANQNSAAGSVTIPRHQVVEYLQLLIDVVSRQSPLIAEKRLNRPARVNSTNFMTGVPVRMVVEAAQRYYDYRQENPPEKDGELQQKFLAAIDSAKRQRITEQDALAISQYAIGFMNGTMKDALYYSEKFVATNEFRELLEKLNHKPAESKCRRTGDIHVAEPSDVLPEFSQRSTESNSVDLGQPVSDGSN